MATFPAAAYFNDAAPTEGEFKQALEDFLASVKAIPGAGIAELPNTISSGSITPAGSGGVVVVDTEAGGATDDLTNIVTTNYPAGSLLLVRNSNAARFVVCKHLAGGAGQFNLDQGGDYTLDNTMKWLMLQRRGTDWFEVLRGPQRPLPVQSPIINGSMDVWQCGTTFTAPSSGSYTADHWLTQYAGSVWPGWRSAIPRRPPILRRRRTRAAPTCSLSGRDRRCDAPAQGETILPGVEGGALTVDSDTSDLDVVLLKARLKSIEYESALLHELVKLQRSRIAQLQQEMGLAPREPEGSATRTETGVCHHCGKPAKQGQVFCQRACLHAAQRAKRDQT